MIRKHFAGFATSALALVVSAQAFAGTVTTDGPDIVIKTKGGLEVATTDKNFSFKLGGRVMVDAGSFDGVLTRNGNRADETYLRRGRLELSGTLYRDFEYVVERNFADTGADDNWKEVSLSYTGWDPVTLTVGRFDPTMGLEEAVSSKWTTAIERSMVYEVADWTNGHMDGEGIRLRTTLGNLFHGELGAYRQGNQDEDGQDNASYVARAVVTPILADDHVLHLGVNYAQRQVEEGTEARMRSRMTVRGTSEDGVNGNRVELGNSFLDGTDSVYAFEAAYMNGPFSVQGEFHKRNADGDATRNGNDNDLEVTGYNMQLAYTLTGESRGYKLDGGKFDKIKPANRQLGAWEVFYRYDNLKVDEIARVNRMTLQPGVNLSNVEAGATAHTLGVNWYANEAIRVSLNYIRADVNDIRNANGDTSGDALTARLQYVF
jgi:phosphate-selective porin OprO/OprP